MVVLLLKELGKPWVRRQPLSGKRPNDDVGVSEAVVVLEVGVSAVVVVVVGGRFKAAVVVVGALDAGLRAVLLVDTELLDSTARDDVLL